MLAETPSRCPFGFERRKETPLGLKKGPALHALVTDGVADAKEKLRIETLTPDSKNNDPLKGWRDALTGIIIDATYRTARPQIEDAYRDLTPAGLSVPVIEEQVIAATQYLFSNIANKTIAEPPETDGTPWLTEVVEELDTIGNPRGLPTATHILSAASTLFEEYGFGLNRIAQELAPDDPNPDLLQKILMGSWESFFNPVTKLHLRDSQILGEDVHDYYEGHILVGYRTDRVKIADDGLIFTEPTRSRLKEKQDNEPLTSVIDGCPALISPRTTQPRYPGHELPDYPNVIRGIYKQMSDQIVASYA
ncbi:MAG TPA: hypothetical protein VG935_04555 [Patescibacteria group bacterium]|nr:hypothetical protein [Patescibacteria group bacterium]